MEIKLGAPLKSVGGSRGGPKFKMAAIQIFNVRKLFTGAF